VDIIGTAATGAPLANATISLKCASASFAGNAQADGSFRIASVPVDAAPCLLRAQQAGTAYVTPVADAGAGTITVNATPLTHLLSSRLLGEPADRAFQNAGTATFDLVNPSGISAARGHVRAQLDRLGITAPGLSSDWIATSFEAMPDDPHDQVLEALRSALTINGLSVSDAALQLASADAVLNLPTPEPSPQACTPRLIDGFASSDRSKWIKVGNGAEQDDGIGIGGGPGFTSGASVEVTFADGTIIRGARTDAATGMVTLVPCSLKSALPALVRMHGEPGSRYYDAGSGQWVSFEGETLHGLVHGLEVDRNLAVTPFTEAVYQRALALGSDQASAAGRFVVKSTGPAWHDPGRIELAHDEVLAAVNDQLPGVYRLERLEHMPLLIDEQGDTEGSQVLPKTPDGVHGAVIAGFAKAAAASRPGDPAPALGISERFAADMANGVLDNPFAGLDASAPGSMLPVYNVDTLWRDMTAGTTSVVFKSGKPEYRADLPFPLALVKPSGYRVDDMFAATQYAGLYSDGILRIVAEVRDDYPPICGYWCDPVRKVRASASTAWWVFEIGHFLDFDIASRIARRPDGSMVSVGSIHAFVTPEALLGSVDFDFVETFPNVHTALLYRGTDGGVYQRLHISSGAIPFEYAEARGLSSLAGMPYSASTAFLPFDDSGDDVGLHLFGIVADGSVQRLVYSFPDYQGGQSSVIPPLLKRRSIVELPARARQLTSDGRLIYALLADGDVYLLNPEVLVSESGFYPVEGVHDQVIQRTYPGRFRPAGLAGSGPLPIAGASNICRIDGIYLVTCGGQLRKIDRSYYWLVVAYAFGNIRAPGAEYLVEPEARFDARGWRALKTPLDAEVVWEDSYFRLLMTVDGRYVLQEDTYGIRLGPGSWEIGGTELSQQVVESWLGG